LDAILNYTFLPHIWNVYPNFFQSPMGPLQGSRVKIRRHDCTQNPLSPRTTTVVAKSFKTLAQNNIAVKIVQCSQSIYNVSMLLDALWHAALAGYALVWIEQDFHKDLAFRTWGF